MRFSFLITYIMYTFAAAAHAVMRAKYTKSDRAMQLFTIDFVPPLHTLGEGGVAPLRAGAAARRGATLST